MRDATKRLSSGTHAAAELRRRALDFGPVVVGPLLALVGINRLPAWAVMWLLALTIYFGFKWLTWRNFLETGATPSVGRSLGYLLLWPGMDAAAFFGPRHGARVGNKSGGYRAAGKAVLGAVLLWAGVRMAQPHSPLLAGWLGMIGLVLLFHVGLFHLLALAWQRAGVAAEPIMDRPLSAASLSEFWGRRWNRAFRDLADAYVYRPVLRHSRLTAALLATFLFSGLLHELAISVPSGGGFGGPTLYFLLQAAALLVAHKQRGRFFNLQRGPAARIFAAVVLIAPLGLLFHRPFVYAVVNPFLHVIGCF